MARSRWPVLLGALWAIILSSANPEVTPVVNIRYTPPLLELLLPTFDKAIGSVDFRYGLDGLVSQEFSSPATFSGTQGWIYSDSNGTTGNEELVWAYAIIYDVKGKAVKETWRSSAYAGKTGPDKKCNIDTKTQKNMRTIFKSFSHGPFTRQRGGFQAFVPDDRVNFAQDGKLYIKP
ncbi:hypothetical protein ElyMa_006006600, partial [Elysia marginata]